MKLISLRICNNKNGSTNQPSLVKAVQLYELGLKIFFKNLNISHAWSKTKTIIYSLHCS